MNALPIIICALGLFLLIKLRFFYIMHPRRIISAVIPSLKSRQSRESFFLALAGTLGVGNIFGVSLGIIVGGAGSVFWICVSAIFSMIIKYSEVLLGFSCSNTRFGMPSVIKASCGVLGAPLAGAYALLGALLSLFMGAIMQTRSIIDTALEGGIDTAITTVIVLILILYFVVFGSDIIKKVTYYIVPLTTIIYILLSLLVIFANFSKIPDTIFYIVKSAFSARGATGGVMGALVRCGFQDGFLRGVMSNEAGAGTSLIGHSVDGERRAGVAGVFGLFEVVFDTLLLCPLTGLVIVVSGVEIVRSPMQLVVFAFGSVMGACASPVLTFLVFSFAYSTLMSLYYYGLVYTEYLSFSKAAFSVLFLSCITISHLFSDTFVSVIDTLLLLMTLPTAFCIIKNVGMIKHHTDELLK